VAVHLRVVGPDATPEEVAAVVAAVRALRMAHAEPAADDTLHEWVRVARLQSRRSGFRRGPWRLSGRRARRGRA